MISKKWIRLSLLFLLIIGAYLGLLCAYITYFANHTKSSPSDSIIVLGAAVWNGKPSPAMRERLDICLGLYREGKSKNIIVTGGAGNDELSEAEVMKTYLVEHGVPESAIFKEDQSRDTWENLQNAKKIMGEHQFVTSILVTHKFHMLRASLMAKSVGFKSSYEPVQIKPINNKYYVLRESLGVSWFVFSHSMGVSYRT